MAVGKRWSDREVVGTRSREQGLTHTDRPQFLGTEKKSGLLVKISCGQEADVYKGKEKKGHVEKEQIFSLIALKRRQRDELVMLTF